MYLLDTDILSNLIKRRPNPALEAKLRTVPREHQQTASITVGELGYGAHRAHPHTVTILQRQHARLQGNVTVVPFDEAAARVYGALRAALERRGTPLAEPDLRIAAIALANNLTLITGNVRHFARVPGLRVENWLAPAN